MGQAINRGSYAERVEQSKVLNEEFFTSTMEQYNAQKESWLQYLKGYVEHIFKEQRNNLAGIRVEAFKDSLEYLKEA